MFASEKEDAEHLNFGARYKNAALSRSPWARPVELGRAHLTAISFATVAFNRGR